MHAGKTSSSQARVIAGRPKWPMSAYSASHPVIARTTEASEKKPVLPLWKRKSTPYVGESAFRTSGCIEIP